MNLTRIIAFKLTLLLAFVMGRATAQTVSLRTNLLYDATLTPNIGAEQDTLPRREFLSVKSNLLLDVAYVPGYDRWCPIPTVAIEYYPKNGHFTFGASFDCPWW